MNKQMESFESSPEEKELSVLMKRAQGGDQVAYVQLLRRIEKMLQGFVRKSIPADLAEDVIQEIILGVHIKRHTFNSEQCFLPWFYAIARYKIVDCIRSLKRRQKIFFSAEDIDLLQVTDVNEVLTYVAPEEIRKIISVLNEKQRRILEKVKLEGLSVKDAALQLHLTESDIKVNIHRALKSLRARFSKKIFKR